MYIGSRSVSGNGETAGSSHLFHITQNKQVKGKNKMKNADSIYQRIERKHCKARPPNFLSLTLTIVAHFATEPLMDQYYDFDDARE